MTLLGQKLVKWGNRTQTPERRARARPVKLSDTGDAGSSSDCSVELMEDLIRQRLKMFEPHIEKWMQVCRDWQPERGLPDEVITAVRSLVEQTNLKTRPLSTVMAVAAAKRWRKVVLVSKLNASNAMYEEDLQDGDEETLPPISQGRPSLLQPTAPHRHLKSPRRSQAHSLSPRPSPRPSRSPSPVAAGPDPLKTSFRWQVQKEKNFSADITDLLRNLFLTRLCDALKGMADNLAAGQTDWTFVHEGVKLMHWICRQSTSLRAFCESKLVIQALVQLCEYMPPTDITRILALVSALRFFLCTSVASTEVQSKRIEEAGSAYVFHVVVKRLRAWMDCAIILHKDEKTSKCNQLLDCLHDLFLELLKHEDMRIAAVAADFVPSFYNLIKDRLLTEPLVWPRSLPMLMDAVTALPRAEYIQCGIDLSKELRHTHVHKGVDTLPSVLQLRMKALRQNCERTPGSSRRTSLAPTPVRSRSSSVAPTPDGSRRGSEAPTPAPEDLEEQGDLLRPCAPAGPSPMCRSPLTTIRQRRKSDSEEVGAKRRRGSMPATLGSARCPGATQAVCAPPALPRTPPRSMGTSPMID